MADTSTRAGRAAARNTVSGGETAEDGFTAAERAAMRERAREVRTAARRGPKARAADGESDVLAKIAAMNDSDRPLAQRLHAIVRAAAPQLTPRTWYGFPAYARDGKVVCFFQPAQKFGTRYATLGFSDQAALDDGALWPVTYALAELTAGSEAAIAALIRTAVSQ